MTTRMKSLQDLVEDINRHREEEYRSWFHAGYEKALQDIRDIFISAPEDRTETIIANGDYPEIVPALSPVYARAAKYIADHPGSTRREIMEYGSVRGKKVIDMLVARGLVRRDTLPVSKRKPREAYVRYYPA